MERQKNDNEFSSGIQRNTKNKKTNIIAPAAAAIRIELA
jgi:hypothetical protein